MARYHRYQLTPKRTLGEYARTAAETPTAGDRRHNIIPRSANRDKSPAVYYTAGGLPAPPFAVYAPGGFAVGRTATSLAGVPSS